MTSPRRNDEQTTTIGARKARRTLNNTSSQPPCVICEETNNKRHTHCHLRRNKVTSSSTIHDDAARTSLYKKGLSQASCVRLACSVATCLYIYSLLSPLSTGNAAYVSDDHLLRAFLTFFSCLLLFKRRTHVPDVCNIPSDWHEAYDTFTGSSASELASETLKLPAAVFVLRAAYCPRSCFVRIAVAQTPYFLLRRSGE